MATNATLEKLKNLSACQALYAAEVKFVLKHWEDATTKLQNIVIRSVKALDKIPPVLQLQLIDCHEKSVKAIGELLCPDAQDLVIAEFPDDLPAVVSKALEFRSISLPLWKHLAKCAKDGTLSKAKVKKLLLRKDCPPQFLKAIGVSETTVEKEQAKRSVKKLKPRPAKTVKAKSVAEDDFDEDFDDLKKVARVVKTIKRPRS